MKTAAAEYQGAAGDAYHLGKRAIPAEAIPWICRLRAEKFQPFVQPNDVVFEMGIGAGWNLLELKCIAKIGFDVTDLFNESLSKKGIQLLASLNDLLPHSMDVIICHHVLEHVENPADTLRQLKTALKPTGRLLLNVPYETERKFRVFRKDEPNHHLYSWNPQTLGNLIYTSQLIPEFIRLQPFRFDRYAAVLACKLGVGESAYRLLRKGLLTLAPEHEIFALVRP
jgi:SAM-dependent methyltransferase